jgi:hypothetical protein
MRTSGSNRLPTTSADGTQREQGMSWRQLLRPRGARELVRAVVYWAALLGMVAYGAWLIYLLCTGRGR